MDPRDSLTSVTNTKFPAPLRESKPGRPTRCQSRVTKPAIK